jgi:predicted anti-sigma-YlaC factor YlaD
MKRHLTKDEISALVAGEGFASAEASAHVLECGECQAEVHRLEGVLINLRVALREQAAPPPSFVRPAEDVPETGRRSWMTGPRWALAGGLAVATLALIPAWRTTPPKPEPQVAVLEVSDAALLQQVDEQLNRAIPGSMEPLVALAWSSTETGTQGNHAGQ